MLKFTIRILLSNYYITSPLILGQYPLIYLSTGDDRNLESRILLGYN